MNQETNEVSPTIAPAYCFESFQAGVQGRGIQEPPCDSLNWKDNAEFEEVKVTRVHRTEYYMEGSYTRKKQWELQ